MHFLVQLFVFVEYIHPEQAIFFFRIQGHYKAKVPPTAATGGRSLDRSNELPFSFHYLCVMFIAVKYKQKTYQKQAFTSGKICHEIIYTYTYICI